MKVIFYVEATDSGVLEVPDGTPDWQLQNMACDFVADNVDAYYEIVEDE